MVRQKFPCKNHSERKTSKRCFLCKDYICGECQNKWSHHLFCGYFCYLKFYASGYIQFLKTQKKLISLFLIVQILTILFIFQFIPENVLETEIPIERVNRAIIAQDSIGIFAVDTLTIPNSNKMVFSGQTITNSLLGLWHNGKIVQSTITKTNTYSFKPVPLFIGNNSFKIVRIDSLGENVLIDSVKIDYSSPRIQQLMKSVSKIKTKERIFSLTFDAGSIITGADSILHILAENKIQTTFFLTGKFIIRNPELTQKIINAGHEIGNHSYSHPHLTQFESNLTHKLHKVVNREFVQKELLKADSVFYAKFNRRMVKYWRAPFGEYNKKILQWAAEIGYKHIKWSKNGDLADWVTDKESSIYKTTNDMYQQILDMQQNGKLEGSIILMHLGTDRKEELPYKMLQKLINQLKKIDYKIVKISNLLKLQIFS